MCSGPMARWRVMPVSDPLVEELLEKTAQALLDIFGSKSGATTPSAGHRLRAQQVLAAQFGPGWRDGISREWGNLWPDGEVTSPGKHEDAARMLADAGQPLRSRWVGPWLPVEDETG